MKKFYDIFTRPDTMYQRDRRTDRRTNRWTDRHRATAKTALTHSVAR